MQGFTYVWLLFVLAIGSAGAATLAQVWSTATQRDREREQIFRGNEYAHALWSFQAASGVGPARPPRTLDELVEDRRSPSATRPLRHLRRLYEDPVTGRADWVVERDEQQAIIALRSRSMQPSRIVLPGEGAPDGSLREPAEAASAPPHQRLLSDRRFTAKSPPGPAASAPDPASSQPSPGQMSRP